ncbi:MAG: Slp family lipoprotein [Deltaproteobacteria bacterium]|nr:Slp family lipoprotein [Deltaproteobacteria bacterium]
MKAKRYITHLLCLVTLTGLVMTGCAAVISQEALKEVDQSVRFEELLENPHAHRGRVVLLGGEIIKTENLPDKTVIIMLQRSLGYNQKPDSKGESKGRFIVSAPGFLDPAIYRPHRKITVVGVVVGKEIRSLGEIEYAYPIISKRELHVWPSEDSPKEPRVHFGIGIGIGL